MNIPQRLSLQELSLNTNNLSWATKIALIIGGTALLWLSAKIQVPFYPVPQTLQSMVIVLLGIFLGSVLGTATVFAYLIEGAVGLPVFAGTPEKGIGLAYMTGPTAGYLIGFLLATLFAGSVVHSTKFKFQGILGYLALSMVSITALAIIYIPGVLWLAYLVGFEKAMQYGLMPFIIGDLAKGLIAAAIVCLFSNLYKKMKLS